MLAYYLLVLCVSLIPLTCSKNVTSADIRPSRCLRLDNKHVWLNTQLVEEIDSYLLGDYMKFCCSCVDEIPSWFPIIPSRKYKTISAKGVDRDETLRALLQQIPKFVLKAIKSDRPRLFVCTHARRRKFIWFEKTHEMTCYIRKGKKNEHVYDFE